MAFKKFTSDASSFFERTIQKTEEALKTSERTMLDANIENMMKQCDLRQRWTTSFIALSEAVIQPNPATRMEDMVLKGLDRKKARTTEDEQFGESLVYVGNELGASSPSGALLIKFGQAQSQIGEQSKHLQERVNGVYIQPLRDYLANTVKNTRVERDALENYRLDLDRAKNQLRRAGEDGSKKQQAEQAVTEKQALFDRQCETAKRAMELCLEEFEKQQTHVNAFLNAEREYYEKCLQTINSALG